MAAAALDDESSPMALVRATTAAVVAKSKL
jgi:hypothetical protein